MYTTAESATLAAGGLDLLRPLAALARLEQVHTLLLPATEAGRVRGELDRAGAAWLLLVAGRAAMIFSDAPFPPAALRPRDLAPGVRWTPDPRAVLGPVAAALALAFAASPDLGGPLLAAASPSLCGKVPHG